MDQTPARTGWIVPAAVAAAGAFGQWITLEPWTAAFLAQVVWLPGAVLMCGLLATPANRWPVVFAAALLGSAFACLEMGRTLLPHCIVLIGEFALVGAASWWLQTPARDGHIERVTGCDPTRFLLLAGILLPLAGAAWTHAASGQFGMTMGLLAWQDGRDVLARSVGYLVVVPAVVAAMRLSYQGSDGAVSDIAWLDVGRHLLKTSILAVGAIVVVALWMAPIARGQAFPVVLLTPLMLLVWIDHAFGSAWTRLTWLPLSAACTLLTAFGIGPLVHDAPQATMSHVQWWSIGCSVVVLLLSALRDQRGESREALRDSGERLSHLARRAMTMQENERSRIARDLHDDVNQSLAAISIELSSLKRGADLKGRDRLEGLQERLLGVSDDIRRLSHELHPSMLRYTSLAASLEGLCASHSRDDFHVRCDTDESFDLTEPQKLDLFRIAQEALHNVEKHADARHVRIELRREGERMALLRVEDDGRGFPEDRAAAPRRGLGLISMAERARTLQGNLALSAGQRGGTRVDVRFPVAAVSVEVLRPAP